MAAIAAVDDGENGNLVGQDGDLPERLQDPVTQAALGDVLQMTAQIPRILPA